MICVKFTVFCDLQADLRIRLATLRKYVRKFWFCKLTLTCVDLRVRLARTLGLVLWLRLGLGLGFGLGFDPFSPIVRELVLSLTRLSFVGTI